MSSPFDPNDLKQFTGSETYYRHSLNRRVIYTEGVQFLAVNAQCYWLLDEIMLIQPPLTQIQLPEFQCWTLTVKPDSSAVLVCTDGNNNEAYRKHIPWTDFPFARVDLWFANDTLYLPSEH